MGSFNNTAGSGVEKGSANNASFKRYWRLFFDKFWTFFKINLVYFLFCIPIVTIGPATAALTAMMRNIYLERPQFIFSDFKQLFKENFKRSFVIGIVNLMMIEAAVFVFRFWDLFVGEGHGALKAAIIVGDVLLTLVSFYIYPQIVALELPLGDIVKNSVILVFLNPGREIIALVLVASYAMLLIGFPIFVAPLAPFIPLAILAFTVVYCCYPAIQRVIINPYYERSGERNPEILEEGEDALFEDMGGKENAVTFEKKERGKKIIK